jgi:hypothetical protein
MRRLTIFCHRWSGLAFCLLFAWWFVSGIFMMYVDFPGVSSADRIDRAQPIDSAAVRLSPADAISRLSPDAPVSRAVLEVFDGRPAYRFFTGRASSLVYADDGSIPRLSSPELLLRVAAEWAGESARTGQISEMTEADQWTIEFGRRIPHPLWTCTFGDGRQVYISGSSGEVVQYTTPGSRVLAYLGPIAHWLYFTPLRKHQKLWSNIVIWLSGVGTIMALLGLIAGVSIYRVRTGNPYRGPKRLHMTLGLCFGVIACTWSFSGMLSMDPFPIAAPVESELLSRLRSALRPDRFRVEDYQKKSPRDALRELNGVAIKQLELTSSGGIPFYLAALSGRETKVVPVSGEPSPALAREGVLNRISTAAQPVEVAAETMLKNYDAWYLDRNHEKPLPVLLVRFRDPLNTRVYVDLASGHIVAFHSDSDSMVTRWLYHGLHSLDFPWLYNYRPLWDVVVLSLMLGGLALSVTSVVIAARLLKRISPGNVTRNPS